MKVINCQSNNLFNLSKEVITIIKNNYKKILIIPEDMILLNFMTKILEIEKITPRKIPLNQNINPIFFNLLVLNMNNKDEKTPIILNKNFVDLVVKNAPYDILSNNYDIIIVTNWEQNELDNKFGKDINIENRVIEIENQVFITNQKEDKFNLDIKNF